MIINSNHKNKILGFAIVCSCCMLSAPQARSYDSLIQAIGDTVSPRTYELTSNETTSAVLGTMGGANDAVFTVDGGANNYGIINTSSNKDARLYISKQAQTFNLQNVGSYTTTTSDSIIAGKSVITDVVVGNAVKDFGIIDPASANNSSYTGFLRSAGKSNVTNSVFYNIKGLYGAAIQNRENGTLSVKNSVFVGNTSMQGAIHNDSTQKIADISDSVFYNNTAAFVTSSGNNNISSAIHNKSGKTIDLITKSTFTNNTATGDSKNIAATIYNGGTIGTISDSIFYNNTSVSNGAIMYNDSTGTITTLSGSYFVNNTAVGGILETKGSISNLSNLTFTGNTVEKNGIISLHNDTAASSISIGEINNVQVTGNTGSGIYIRTGKSDSTLNIGKITGGTKFNNNTEDGLYMGGNSGIINVTEISNSEFSNNTKTGFYIQNINSGSGQITISKITDNTKINGNLEGGILLQRNGSNTLGVGEISDTEIKNNTITTLTKRGAGLRNEGAHITKMSGVVFENDNLDYTTNGTLGGAIYNSAYGQIDEMTDITISNCSAYNGGAMYNLGTIGSIDGMMVSNIDTSDVMIATEENAHIETINNMTIQNSAGTGLSFYGGTGGTIQNSTFTNMYGAGAKMGYGLQVTAKPNAINGHVDLIDNITVAGNQTGGMRIDDNKSTGGYTANVGLIKNSQFTNNGTTGNEKAGGIWAKTDVLTISADGAGKTTTFKGNKRQNEAVGIWMENKNSILNLQQLNSGEMFMYDPINGTSNRYYVNISGDNSGTLHLYDDIKNGMVDVKTTNVSTIDGKIHDYSFATLSSDTNSKYTLDIFFDTNEIASTIDTFTISNVNLTPETGILKETAGTITLHALNFLNDVDASMIGKSATLQVIKAPVGNSLILENGFELDPEGWVLFTLQDDVKTEYDPVYENTDWSDKIKIYDIATKVLGDVDIITTDTTKDTLKITIAQSTKTKNWNGNYQDTLLAVNQANLATRNFTTDVSSAVYNVTDNLGVTAAGNFNIKGKDSELSLIDFNETEHYKGFELNNTTNLTLENVEIKNSSQLVSGMATDVNMNIYNSYLHDNGKGIYSAGNANIEGTTQINDDFYLMGDTSELTVTGQIRGVATPADITFNKKLAGSETSTFTFSSGTVTLGSSASVDDTSLVLNNSVLNVGANNAFSNVNLTAAGADLNLKNESTGVQTFNKLTLNGDMNIGIDVDLYGQTTDQIVVSGAAVEDVAANGHKIIIDSIYILTDGENTETNVILTEDNRFSGVYKLSDDILSHITQASSVSGSYSVVYKDFDSLVDPNKGILIFTNNISDTLASTIVKDVGEEAIKAYTLPSGGETAETNLGTLIGAKLTITGNGETGTNFIKGGDTYTGVVIGDGKTQTLEVNDVAQWSGFTDSAITNKSQGTVKINNVNFSGNGTSDIDNSGKLEFTGTNSLEKVNDSAANGTTEIKSGTTTIANLQQKSVTVSAGKLVVSNNLTTTSGVTNSVANGLEVQGGTINSDISGSGSTNINSTGTVTNNGTISQTINLASGTFNTNAGGIKGGLAVTSGTVELTGGELTTAITGAGATKVEGNVTVGTNGSIANAVTVQGTGSQLTAALSDLTGGVTVNANNSLNLQGQIANGILGTGDVILNEQQNITSDITYGGTIDLNGQTINLQDADLSTSIPPYVYTSSTSPTAPTFKTLTAGSLKGTGSLKIDVDMTTSAGKATNSDKINITSGANNNGTLTLTSVNVTDAGTTSATQYNDYVTYVTGTTTDLTINGIATTITSDNRSFTFSQGSTGKLNVIIREANTTLAQFIQGDNIIPPVTATTFSLTGDLGVNEDLGTTWRDGTPPSPNELYLNLNNHILSSDNHAGATVDKEYTLNVDGGANGGTVRGFATAFTTTADSTNPGTLKINNINFSENTTDIANNGKTEFSGVNTVNTMTGTGSAEIKSGTTTFAGTTADSITQNLITVSGGTLAANANVFNVANGITNSGTVNLTGGTLDTVITGGNITISANVSSNAANLAGTTANESSELTLTGGDLAGNITGSGTTEIKAGSGTVSTGSYTVDNNVIITTGTLASDITKLNGTITNKATFNMTGDLSKNIGGTGTTVLQSTTAVVDADRTVTGTLNLNGKTLGMKDSNYETLTVGNLKTNGNLTLNADATNAVGTSDTIYVNNAGSESELTITELNLTKPTVSVDEEKTSVIRILTGNSSGASLALSSDVSSQYNKITNVTNHGTDSLATYEINWKEDYGDWEQVETTTETLTVTNSNAVLKDSLTYTINKSLGDKTYTDKAENLAIMNTYTGTGYNNRSVDFTGIFGGAEAGTYTVRAALGTSSAGTYTLNGVKGGTQNTTVNLNGNSGFVLANQTTLDIKNINLTGNTTIITVNNEDAVINLTDSNIQGAITGTEDYNIYTSGTSSVQNVTKAAISNSGTLGLSGTNNLISISGNSGTTEISGVTTTVGSLVQNTLTVSAGTLVNNGASTIGGGSNAGTINGTGSLTNTGTFANNGAIAQAVINSGTFTNGGTGITGNVTNTGTFTSNSAITGNVTNSSGTFTENAAITGNVTVNGGTFVKNSDITGYIDIGANGKVEYTIASNQTMSNEIKGTGELNKLGAGTSTLTGNLSNFNGVVDIDGGAISFDTANAGSSFFGSGTVYELADNTKLNITTGESKTVNLQNVSGTGSAEVNKYGGGTVALSGDNSDFAGALNINYGKVTFNNNGTDKYVGGSTTIGTNGILDYTATTAGTLTGVTGVGTLNKSGTANLVLNEANNGFSGTAHVKAGNLTVAGNSASGFGYSAVIEGGNLDYTAKAGTANITIGGAGVPNVSFNGSGNATFTGQGKNNTTYTLGAIAGIAAGNTVTIDNSKIQFSGEDYTTGNYVFDDSLINMSDDAYSDVHISNLTLSGTNSIAIDVNLGTLPNAPQSDTLQIDNLGTGSGTTIGIALTSINLHNATNNKDNGISSPYTFNVIKGDKVVLTREGTATTWATNAYIYDVNLTDDKKGIKMTQRSAANNNSLKYINQLDETTRGFSLTENDTNPYTIGSNLGTTAAGTITVNGNGKTISGADTYSMFEVTNNSDLRINNVTVSDASGTSGSVVSANNASAKVSLNGVAVNGNNSTGNGGAINNALSNQFTVEDSSMDDNHTTDGLGGAIYTASNMTITDTDFGKTTLNTDKNGSNDIYIAGTTTTVTFSTTDEDHSINSGLAGDGTLAKTGAYDLNLSGKNDGFTGTLDVKNGDVNFTQNANTDTYVGGDTKIATGSTVTITNDKSDVTAGNFSGAGDLVKDGTKDMNLTGDNSGLTGTLDVQEGDVNFSQTTAADKYVGGDTQIANGSTVTITNDMSDVTAGNFSGAGDLVKAGTKDMTLTGDNSGLTGTLDVKNGDVNFTQATAADKYVGGATKIANGSTVTITNDESDVTAGNFSGAGDLVKDGTKDMNLTGDNSGLTGTLDVKKGDVNFTQTTAADKYVGGATKIANGSTVTITNDKSDVTAGNFSGAGDLVKDGTKDMNLTGDNSGLTGTLDVQEGDVNFSQTTAADKYVGGATQIADGSTVTITNDESDVTAGNFSGAGDLVKDGTKDMNLTGDNSGLTGTLDVKKGDVNFSQTTAADKYVGGDTKIANGSTVTITNDMSDVTAGNFSGAGDLVKDGTKDMNLTGDNSGLTGTLDVKSGDVNFTQATAADKYVGGDTKIANGSTVTITNDMSDVNTGSFSGTGDLVKDGTKDLNISGDNSGMKGTVTIDNGSVVYDSDKVTKYFGGETVLNANGQLKVKGDNASSVSKISGTGKVSKNGSGKLTFRGDNSGFTGDLDVNEGSIGFGAGSSIGKLNNITLAEGTGINLQNTKAVKNGNSWTTNPNPASIENLNFGTITLNGKVNLAIDVDLKNSTADKIGADNVSGGGHFSINKEGLNVVSDSLLKNTKVRIAEGALANNGYIRLTDDAKVVMGPIQKYDVNYTNGMLGFTRRDDKPSDFNPAVMASPVATQIGGYLTQLETLHDGFFHMERYTKYTLKERKIAEGINKYATSSVPVYQYSNVPETSQAMWVKPYTSFERVNLRGGVKVSNITYGSLFGGDSKLYNLKHNWKGVVSAFIGYNGSHQEYSSISMNQQGGVLGFTATAYKGGFFSGFTASAGAAAGEAYTQYGRDNFAMLTAGVANKSGYNFEFKDGKLVLQPSLFLGYTFVNTFDYTNSAGVRINSDPLNAIQIIPGLKVIGNVKDGWQPYASVSMVWNALDKTHVMANDVRLPNLSVKPYVEYGVGLQKSWGDRFTAYGQAMVRNGGRTGIVLTGGFRWLLGKDNKTSENRSNQILINAKKSQILKSQEIDTAKQIKQYKNGNKKVSFWDKWLKAMSGEADTQYCSYNGKVIIK